MKHFIKITAFFLCLLTIFGLSACSTRDEDIPEGMQNATANGADFRLYLPTTWNLNTPYGISGGYFSLANQSTVSVAKYQPSAALAESLPTGAGVLAARIDAFWTAECKPVLESIALNRTIEQLAEPSDDLLGALPARRYQHKYIANGKDLRSLQVVTERGGIFYVFSFIAHNDASQSLYDQLIGDVEVVIDSFRFADTPYLADEFVKPLDTDAESPEGMFLASNNDVAYRFYAPNGWIADQNNSIFAAYVESDRSSVSVVPYMPEGESMTVAEFWDLTVAELTKTDKSFDQNAVTVTETTLGGRGAMVYEYTYTLGGNTYHYKQAIAAYRSMIYTVTYTAASKDAYNAHLAEVDAILNAFEFR